MELRQLEYLVAVADEGSFTRAAVRLRIAQPGVSAQIAKLERELGQPLLHRSGRRVEPTEAGVAVLAHARAALRSADGARGAAAAFTGLLRGRVRIGMVPACSSVQLASLLEAFHVRHPGVELVLREATADALVDQLCDGSLDLAWVALSGEQPAGLELRVLVDEPYVLAVHPEHHLAGNRRLAVRGLRDEPLACLPRGSGQRSALERACAVAGFTPHVVVEGSAMDILVEIASRGIAAAVLPESLVAAVAPRLQAIAFDDDALRGRVALAWRSDGSASPAGRAMIQLAQDPALVASLRV